MEFKPFPKIERIGKLNMTITQKIHGSNAQVVIFKGGDTQRTYNMNYENYTILIGSRNRWITPEDDNYGFAKFVHDNAFEFIEKLGEGQHFGEWAGPGINSGEGLKEKTFVLFDFWKFTAERSLPPRCVVVPVLYQGSLDLDAIRIVMDVLKNNGSQLAPGFMRPEGVVVTFGNTRYKKVFDAEETQWKKSDGSKAKLRDKLNQIAQIDLSHLLQPIRLEKILSRDERYIVSYPASLKLIVADYVKDLEEEGQITGTDEEKEALKKNLNSQIYPFVKQIVKEKTGL